MDNVEQGDFLAYFRGYIVETVNKLVVKHYNYCGITPGSVEVMLMEFVD